MKKALLVFIWVFTALSAYLIGLRKGSSSSEVAGGIARQKRHSTFSSTSSAFASFTTSSPRRNLEGPRTTTCNHPGHP